MIDLSYYFILAILLILLNRLLLILLFEVFLFAFVVSYLNLMSRQLLIRWLVMIDAGWGEINTTNFRLSLTTKKLR
jgi:hypothetical protein